MTIVETVYYDVSSRLAAKWFRPFYPGGRCPSLKGQMAKVETVPTGI